jgi:predicted nuclease of predicted toxin-antitoxin system
MRLLLDESVPATLRRHLQAHEVGTVVGLKRFFVVRPAN